MQHEKFTSEFQSYIQSLSYEKQLDLALSVCKKLFPDYQDFYFKNNFGDPDILIDMIRLCEEQKVDRSNLQEKLKSLLRISPDSEDFENASYAINACSAVYETLGFTVDKDWNHVYAAGICLTDTIDAKITEEDDLSEEEIGEHPMMIEARRWLLGK